MKEIRNQDKRSSLGGLISDIQEQKQDVIDHQPSYSKKKDTKGPIGGMGQAEWAHLAA